MTIIGLPKRPEVGDEERPTMARYTREHKAETRQRILETAGRRIKQDGIDGAGISAVMADAGLTNGAFYAHFASKEDLVAAVVGDQLAAQAASIAELPKGREGLRGFIDWYLSTEHCADMANGCPSAALLEEVARQGPKVSEAYQCGVSVIVNEVADRLTEDWSFDPELAQTRALGLMTSLIASVQLARALTDDSATGRALAAGIENAHALLETAHTAQN
ncbi:TetR/AcrR family transcriptional regulator [Gordonia sp. HY442]|nr:TetR/AcrR family transcriptional regulator [Gordonia zhenghanii]